VSTICLDSVEKLQGMKLLKHKTWDLPSSATTFEYYECSISVVNEHGRTVVFPEVFQALSAVGLSQGVRAMALAPNAPTYRQQRKVHLMGLKSCSQPDCFACSSVEYSSSLCMNDFNDTQDEYFIALGFRHDGKESVMALALQLDVLATEFDVIRRIRLDPNTAPVEVNMNRFRGLCRLVPMNDGFVLLERMRGRLS
jgi:hypothetical protein